MCAISIVSIYIYYIFITPLMLTFATATYLRRRYHPWRAPGHSPTVDPCGMGGAYILAKEGGIAPQGSSLFARGSALPVGVRTKWAARDVVEVGWMVGSNHGGGYLYSLCPSGEPLTEECFQMGTLPFVGDTHTIRYLDNKTEFTIPAMDVNEGTWPAGSAWRRNPIPACNCDQGDECVYDSAADLVRAYANDGPPHPKGDAVATGNDCPFGTQFPVPFPYVTTLSPPLPPFYPLRYFVNSGILIGCADPPLPFLGRWAQPMSVVSVR